MRTLRIISHISLDGAMQVSNCGDDFPYGDWTAPYRTPAGAALVLEMYGEAFDLVLGRRTYDAWSAWWPKAPPSPMADRLNAAVKHVATHRPESLEWGPAEGLGADPLEGIRRLKSGDGPNLVLSGSSTLTSAALAQGLADGVLLIVYPALLGGKALLRRRHPRPLPGTGQHQGHAHRSRPQRLQGPRAYEGGRLNPAFPPPPPHTSSSGPSSIHQS